MKMDVRSVPPGALVDVFIDGERMDYAFEFDDEVGYVRYHKVDKSGAAFMNAKRDAVLTGIRFGKVEVEIIEL
jgi:hypothetical protein